jgi:NAD(P)-dependent dehydrogenase (short-subunit alcohol dehydrogenase family)
MGSPHAEKVKSLVPLKRMGDASEVAGFVSYLASEEAGFITGASLTIDGGYVALPEREDRKRRGAWLDQRSSIRRKRFGRR